MDKQKIAILGGTFNPPHWGHLALLHQVWQQLGMDALQILPAQPWQKKTLPSHHRQNMVQLAVDAMQHAYPGICTLNTLELESTQASYTINTLQTLTDQYQHTEFYWIMGQDQWLNLPTWHRWQELLQWTHLVVFPRNATQPVTAGQQHIPHDWQMDWDGLFTAQKDQAYQQAQKILLEKYFLPNPNGDLRQVRFLHWKNNIFNAFKDAVPMESCLSMQNLMRISSQKIRAALQQHILIGSGDVVGATSAVYKQYISEEATSHIFNGDEYIKNA